MSTLPYRAEPRTLGRATVAALAGGAAILLLFVLPAEYGIDPTGVGGAIGLRALSGDPEDVEDAEVPAPAAVAAPAPAPAVAVGVQDRAAIMRSTPWRTDEQTVTIAPHEGVEIKAEMKTGDNFVFRWTATGPVKMDMHGETSMTATTFSTWWKQKDLREAQGSFTAPFAGIHGWYWRNQGETPVTLALRTTGFYARLFKPTG